MFTDELKNMLIQVITSWQVIAVTLAILIYIAIVNRVSRSHYKRRPPPMPRPVKSKKEESPKQEEIDDSELGLGE